jgi:monothiol glutaredoxin
MDEQIRAKIQKAIDAGDVVLFMKGTRRAPACGFSGKTVELLDTLLDEYQTVDVLAHPEIRDGIKEFSSWPTLPQLYVRGKFVGGADIIAQSFEEGTLDEMLGLPPRALTPPQISVSEQAAEQFRQYLGDSEEVVVIDIDAGFQTGLSIAPLAPNLITLEVAGIRLAMDRLTAGRADGISIEYLETPNGGAFKVTNPKEPAKVRQLTPSALKAWFDRGDDFVLVDVRTPGEWNTARIQGARLLDAETLDELEQLPKDKKLVFQCHHGHRSQRAAEQFLSRGFREVFNLAGGIEAWSVEVDSSVPRY